MNLAGIPSLRSTDLAGLVSPEALNAPLIESLIINNTGIDDEAAVYISACPSLVTLGVAGTRLTSKCISDFRCIFHRTFTLN